MALRLQGALPCAMLLVLVLGCGSDAEEPPTPASNTNACVTGGFSKSLAEGTPHPSLVAAVKAVGPLLGNDDLVALDALDLRQPVGTLLANESFAKIWYATEDLRTTCVPKPTSIRTTTLVRPLAGETPPTTCPTAEELGATLTQLRGGTPSGDVEGTLAASASKCETTFRDGKELPSVDGMTPAPPVPLATIAEHFRQEGDALLGGDPTTARAFLDLATMLERMQKESITGAGDINAVLQPLGAAFEAFQGPNGRVDIEVRGQVSVGAGRRFLTREDLRATRDLGACIGLGSRVSIVLDTQSAQARNAAACETVCDVASTVLESVTRSCGSGSQTKCAPIDSDPKNCGGCGVACKQDERCAAGACKAKSPPPTTSDAIKNGTFTGSLAPWTVVQVTKGDASIVPTPPGSCPAGRENNSFAALEVPGSTVEPPRELYLTQTFTVPTDATTLELTVWNAFQPTQVTVMIVLGGVETTLESFVPPAVYASVPPEGAAPPCSGSAAVTRRYPLTSFAGKEVALRLYAKGNDKDDLAAVCIDDVKMTK